MVCEGSQSAYRARLPHPASRARITSRPRYESNRAAEEATRVAASAAFHRHPRPLLGTCASPSALTAWLEPGLGCTPVPGRSLGRSSRCGTGGRLHRRDAPGECRAGSFTSRRRSAARTLSARPAGCSSSPTGPVWPHGIVAYVDLGGDEVESTVEASRRKSTRCAAFATFATTTYLTDERWCRGLRGACRTRPGVLRRPVTRGDG